MLPQYSVLLERFLTQRERFKRKVLKLVKEFCWEDLFFVKDSVGKTFVEQDNSFAALK